MSDAPNAPDFGSEDVIVLSIGPGGDVRGLYDDDSPIGEMPGHTPPARASNVEPVRAGPFADHWHVDLSPLGEGFGYCLWPPARTRKEALYEERKHVIERWVRGVGDVTEPETRVTGGPAAAVGQGPPVL